ncbi:carbohydrate ABC transporter permease [Cohnella nanjingensis]|uniref:Carbohydrate ABC transporter permease n=1 Tax=Cohnella nanjingensis TaxID=1387779 RepID=A0A7X0RN30_9BACL|nr:carbohydrate ABC transporter permease [Cohnella nanjingensis]MBB6670490.1 carbohydrate ABC transporter permease [Cohnella nanjingensis]
MSRSNARATALLQYLLLLIGLAVFIGPLLWLVSTMLKTQGQSLEFPPRWIPDPVTTEAFSRLFRSLPLAWHWLGNSLLIAVLVAIGTVLSGSLVAFGFARTQARSKNALFIVLMATMMIPYQTTLIPLYLIYKNIGWYDTWLPLIVPSYLAGAFYVFLFRQFFLTVPRELDEATYIDGGTSWTVYTRILLPLSVPVLMTGAIFAFVFSWADFFSPFLFLQTAEKYTFIIGLQLLIGTQSQDLPALAAGSMISLLPIAILYLFAQRYFTEGVVLTGTKG